MSMNYYLAARDGTTIHLGKSTMREFMFESHPALGSFAEVRDALSGGTVLDDTERVVPKEEFIEIATAKGSGRPYSYGGNDQYRDAEGGLFCNYEFC
jgi:hypothetical protein